MSDSPLWTPSEGRIASANLTAYLSQTGFSDYPSLHRWSIDEPDAFWKSIWQFTSIIGDMGSTAFESGQPMLSSRFFPDARLNIAENFLAARGAGPAIISLAEDGARTEISWDDLRSQVLAVAGALKAAGIEPGDRVAAWLPLIPEAVILLLAASAIGATYSSTSPDFGTAGVLDRFGQIEPKILVAATGYQYGGKWFDCMERLAEIRRGIPALKRVIVVERGDHHHSEIPAADLWRNWIRAPEPLTELQRFPFDQPWLILYSSGTTGKPKCIVHRAGGVFLNLKKEHTLHCDVKKRDRLLYFTTTGWMMFNWLVNGLACGATIVLYDGNPMYPDAGRLLHIADQERLTLLGVSARFVDGIRKAEASIVRNHQLSELRTICSTGSPLSPESFAWVYSALKSDMHLASISGGTDLCGCFALGNPTEPVYAGELQRPGLGMAVDIWDEQGKSLRNRPGVAGELVCTRPFPPQPLMFWGDREKQLYRRAYFEKFPGVWAHGDFASWTAHGGVVIHGRSDATLNPGGVRIGTAEIYRVVEQIPGIIESLIFGQQWDGDVRVVLLVRLVAGVVLTGELKAEIRRRIRASCTARHVPAVIVSVADLPRTRSNKLVELAVSDALNGRPVRNLEALANPEALEAIAEIPELKDKEH